MSTDLDGLPFVDEHLALIDAPAEAVWQTLGHALRVRLPLVASAAAAVLGAQSRASVGEPLRAGSTLPGFTVTTAEPGRRLVLTGRHRFSRYALIFSLTDRNGQTQLAARTHASFPGVHGRLYRAVVIGSGGHRLVVNHMLRGIRRAAERSPR